MQISSNEQPLQLAFHSAAGVLLTNCSANGLLTEHLVENENDFATMLTAKLEKWHL